MATGAARRPSGKVSAVFDRASDREGAYDLLESPHVKTEAIADGIYRVLTDDSLRHDMVRKGIARAGQFSWEQSVRRIRQIYGEVAGQP